MSSSPHLEAVLFKPYEAKAFRSDVKHRQKRKTPEGVYTCWEINTFQTSWSDTVPCCAPCGRFKAEKGLKSRLRKLKSNRDSGRAYQCDTFWQDSEPQRKKKHNVVSPAGNYEPVVDSERPSKRCRVSPASPLVSQETPSPVKNRTSPPARKQKSKLPATDCDEQLQSLCDDLEFRLKLSGENLAEAKKEKQTAVGNCRRLQQQYEDAQKLITNQCLLHEQLVSELKQRLEDVEELQKADASYVERLEADANMEHLAVPQNVEPKGPSCVANSNRCRERTVTSLDQLGRRIVRLSPTGSVRGRRSPFPQHRRLYHRSGPSL
jgi:hypothetical protein